MRRSKRHLLVLLGTILVVATGRVFAWPSPPPGNQSGNGGFNNGFGQNFGNGGFNNGFGQNFGNGGFNNGFGQNFGNGGFNNGFGQNFGNGGFGVTRNRGLGNNGAGKNGVLHTGKGQYTRPPHVNK